MDCECPPETFTGQRSTWVATGTAGYTRRLEEYGETVLRRFPGLPPDLPGRWALPGADVLVLGLLLDCLPQPVNVLDLGPPDGISALYLAGQPGVAEVVCAGGHLPPAKEMTDDTRLPRNLSLLDVSRAALEDFPESTKIRFPGSENDPPRNTPSVALVRGALSRAEVRERLVEAFESNPQVLAVVSGCRGADGPFVQAGVADFIEGRKGLEVRTLGDLGPGLAASGLGLVFSRADSGTVEEVMGRLASEFSRRLDPLTLLSREEELVRICNRLKEDLEQSQRELAEAKARNERLSEAHQSLKENNGRLHQENAGLSERQSTVPHRLAEVVVRGADKNPILRNMLRREEKGE